MAARIFAGFSGLARKPQKTPKHMAARVFAGFSGLADGHKRRFEIRRADAKTVEEGSPGKTQWNSKIAPKKQKSHLAPTAQKHMAARVFAGFFRSMEQQIMPNEEKRHFAGGAKPPQTPPLNKRSCNEARL